VIERVSLVISIFPGSSWASQGISDIVSVITLLIALATEYCRDTIGIDQTKYILISREMASDQGFRVITTTRGDS
jgi:hypothetical protein